VSALQVLWKEAREGMRNQELEAICAHAVQVSAAGPADLRFYVCQGEAREIERRRNGPG
jgi:hypothetical protein